MIFNINYDFEKNGIYSFKTNLGAGYKVSFKTGTDLTRFSIVSDNKFSSEVFTTVNTLKFIINKISFNKLSITIDNLNPIGRRRMVNILKRWLIDYEYQVIENPQLPAIGREHRGRVLNITQILLRKKNIVVIKKYCTNCGTEDNGYKFCPNCGTNLQV